MRANSPTNSEVMVSTAPATVSHRLRLLRNGKATSRAPICSGMTKLIKPTTSGMATKKIMIVPWAVKI